MSDKKILTNLDVSGEVKVEKLTLVGQYSLPLLDGSAGQVITTDGAGNLSFVNANSISLTPSSIINGTGISWTYNLALNTLQGNVTLAPFTTTNLAEGVNLYFTNERVDDRVSALLQAGTTGTGANSIAWNYNDALNTLTPVVSLAPFNSDALAEGITNKYYTDEKVDDRVAALMQPGLVGTGPNSIVWNYNDGLGTLRPVVSLTPFSTTNLSEGSNLYFTNERVDDRISNLVQNTATITWTYDDVLNTLEADAIAAIEVQDAGSTVASQGIVNFIAGTDISLSIINDIPQNRINVTIDNCASLGPNAAVVILGNGILSTVRKDSCNDAAGPYSTVSGGYCNIAAGSSSTVAGGFSNESCGDSSSILAGSYNCISANVSTIGGGTANCISSNYSTIAGGQCNTNTLDYSTIGGGQCNYIDGAGNWSTISGGYKNYACDAGTTISGGYRNYAQAAYATTSGGYCNSSNGCYSTVSGGLLNTASCDHSTISGGKCNVTCDTCSTISGGYLNVVNSEYGVVGGGCGNLICSGGHATISGGKFNCMTNSAYGTIAGGRRNCTCCTSTSIGGGCCNFACRDYSTVSGGRENFATGLTSTISGGYGNTASNYIAVVGGGRFNTASGVRSTISGGRDNTASGNCSAIGGGQCNTASCGYSTISGGYLNTAAGLGSTVSGGCGNSASGQFSVISGGRGNSIACLQSTIAGGLSNAIIANFGFIGSGFCNLVAGNYSAVLGGSGNVMDCIHSGAYGSNIIAQDDFTFHVNQLSLYDTPVIDQTNTALVVRDATTGILKTRYLGGIFTQTADSATVAATVTETSIVGTGIGSLTVPANGFAVGDSFKVYMGGLISAANNETITFKIKSGSVTLADSGAITMSTASNRAWSLDLNFVIRAIGAATVASIHTSGFFIYGTSGGDIRGGDANSLNNTTFDTTTSNTLSITVTWGSANVANSIYSDSLIMTKAF